MVLNACPDILDYAKAGISNWRDFIATAAVIRSMLGVSPSAWEDAQAVMGEGYAAIAVQARADAHGAHRKPEEGKKEGVMRS